MSTGRRGTQQPFGRPAYVEKVLVPRTRVSLEVRLDNIAGLTLVLNLKGSSKALNRVARELALNLGDAASKLDLGRGGEGGRVRGHRPQQTCCLGNSATLQSFSCQVS